MGGVARSHEKDWSYVIRVTLIKILSELHLNVCEYELLEICPLMSMIKLSLVTFRYTIDRSKSQICCIRVVLSQIIT